MSHETNRSVSITRSLSWRATLALAVAASVVGAPSNALAQQVVQDLGPLAYAEAAFSEAMLISADGSTIVGRSADWSQYFRWTAAEGMVPLDDASWQFPLAISADGAVIAGSDFNNAPSRWTREGGWQLLPGGGIDFDFFELTAMSADGSVMVGWGSVDLQPSILRWSEGGGLQPIGLPASGYFQGSTWLSEIHLSADGSTVLMRAGAGETARWTAKEGWREIGSFGAAVGANGPISRGPRRSISADGNIVVGTRPVTAVPAGGAMVAGGGLHTIALKTDGSVRCWGNNGNGQCDVPAGLGAVSMVAGGEDHTIALTADGSVWLWGASVYGQCNAPADLGAVSMVAGGAFHTIALQTDGSVRCWGNNGSGQCNVPADLGAVSMVAGGGSHTIALKADGSVRCWGYNGHGQCNVPADLGAVSMVAGGGSHTIALKADGSVRCWGYNVDGQCDVPAGLGSVSAVAAGVHHTIALKADGSVRCWGYNVDGQCNVPADLGAVSMVAGGASHTIALKTDGSVRCWGSNVSGQLGTPHAFVWTDDGTAGGSMVDLGGYPMGETFATQINPEGTVIGGWWTDADGGTQPMRWTKDAQGQWTPSAWFAIAAGFSGDQFQWSTDCSTVAGYVMDPLTFGWSAFRWTPSGGMAIPAQSGVGFSHWPIRMSADGSVLAGSDFTSVSAGESGWSPSWTQRAMRWNAAGDALDLGALEPTRCSISATSADGSVMVGATEFDTDDDGDRLNQAFRWTAAGGYQSLGFAEGTRWSFASGVSADGQVIVGAYGALPRWWDAAASHAFRWTSTGGVQDLDLGDGSAALAVSADGSTVVGVVSVDGVFRWNEAEGMQYIGGGLSVYAGQRPVAVSADGSVVAWLHLDGFVRRWTAATGEVNVGLYAGTSGAFVLSSDGTTIAVDYRLWDAQAGHMNTDVFIPRAISADGSVVFGGSQGDRWTKAGGRQVLLPDGWFFDSDPGFIGAATDGSAAFGAAWGPFGLSYFRWTESDGFVPLDELVSGVDADVVFQFDLLGIPRDAGAISGNGAVLYGGVIRVGVGGSTYGKPSYFRIEYPKPPSAVLVSVTHATCGAPNGAIDATVSDATSVAWTGPYGFASSSVDIANLTPGHYAMVATGPGGTRSVLSVDIDFEIDTTPPVITSVTDQNRTLAANWTCTAAMPDLRTAVHATDNCPLAGFLTVVQGYPAGAALDIGVTQVEVWVIDSAGNASASTTVTITVTGTPATYYADYDHDGYGDPFDTTIACGIGGNYIAAPGDQCPSDPAKQSPGGCGCGVADTDADADGRADCVDVSLAMQALQATVPPSGPYVVRVSAMAATPIIPMTAVQMSVSFDASRLSLIDVLPVSGGPFAFELVQSVNNTSGSLRYAVGVSDSQSGMTGSAALVDFVFEAKPGADLCASDVRLVWFAPIGAFTTKFSLADGRSATNLELTGLESVDLDVEAPVIAGVPDDIFVATDAGSTYGAFVAAPTVTATDACVANLVPSLLVTYPSGATGSAWPASGMFPIGVTTLRWTASDPAGHVTEVTRTVGVGDYQLLDLSVRTDSPLLGSTSRVIRVKSATTATLVQVSLGPWQGSTPSVGTASGIQLPVAASHACLEFKDIYHSVTVLDPDGVSIADRRYVAQCTLVQGDSDEDDIVDVSDFGVFVVDRSTAASSARSPDARSNFNADGLVNNADVGVIVANFFLLGESCGGALDGRQPRSRISVKELRRSGRGDLAAADLNGDGWLDVQDIGLCLQGGGAPRPAQKPSAEPAVQW